MTYHETSGDYTICSIGGSLGSPDATYEAAHRCANFAVNLPTAEAAREACREHAVQLKADQTQLQQAAATTTKG